MLDFLQIATKETKTSVEIYPIFLIKKSRDLMIRGKDFYAIWDENNLMWSTDEDDAVRLIDNELTKYAEDNKYRLGDKIFIRKLINADSGSIDKFHKYCQKQMRDRYVMLDEGLIFANTDLGRENFASKRLDYSLEPGDHSAWDKIISTLYEPEEKHKIEWAIGSIVSGDSKELQKFMVLYGAAGTGKSTILNIIQELFKGYYSTFDAKALGQANNSFALEPFKTNPLVAIQHDGDLSRIEDNTRLNSLVSHELMTVNEKFKGLYETRFKCFLFMGTNRPVKITDGKSGLLRRLIDVHPSGNKLPIREYRKLVKQVMFELGAIAQHCLDIYKEDPEYYDEYVPMNMLDASNDFYNFMCDSYTIFSKEGTTTLKASWEMYKNYCDDAKVTYPYPKRQFKEELKNYFLEFEDRFIKEDGTKIIGYYSGFRKEIFEDSIGGPKKKKIVADDQNDNWLVFEEIESVFDKECATCLAQYASKYETPIKPWDEVTDTLSNIDSSKLHYVKVPENHIVIDFDIKDENGNKSFEKNLQAASKWPPTYAELSKSGGGIHLHYIYTGKPSELSRIFDEDIEIKVFTGKSSLRRKLSKCTNLNITVISSGLPLREVKKVNFEGIKNEQYLRSVIKKHLNKEIMGNTAPSIQMIKKLLDEAYESGIGYDVTDLENSIYALAMSSHNQADACLKLVSEMEFRSKDISEESIESDGDENDIFIVYDTEIFPNYFILCYKILGEGNPVVPLINPTSDQIAWLLQYKLIDFNGRNYDRHLLHARLMGYTIEQLYKLSQRIINSPKGSKDNGKFGVAYNYGYTDVYDFAAKKQSLKKWEIELGIGHKELGLPWDEPISDDKLEEVIKYCKWDVLATEAVFNHLQGDFTARKILADLAGGTVNDTTNALTTRIIFGNERHPKLIYTDLATGKQYDGNDVECVSSKDVVNEFPGYEFIQFGDDNKSHNMYMNTDIGFGGYIISNPGIYGNVALLDVVSLHPHSIIAMNCFGEYTQNFKDLLDARVAIKNGEFDKARTMLGGKLAPYLEDESQAGDLAQALKIAINSVYGLTSAKFDNPFRDPRNKNNIVALRGALMMRTLQEEVEKRGYKIVAIKTDSIKIADADKDIIDFCMEFAKKYSYKFEFEAYYDKICQINDADYAAKYKSPEYCEEHFGFAPKDNRKHSRDWTVTGKQFAIPYVFKTLFSRKPIEFEDMCETFQVKTALYLDMNEALPDVREYEKELDKTETKYKKGKLSDITFEAACKNLIPLIEEGHDYHFVGKVGQFTPVKPGCGGGVLLRSQNGKYYATSGSTGFRWLESEIAKNINADDIDTSYYKILVDKMIDEISKYGDVEWFLSDDEYVRKERMPNFMNIPENCPEELPWD